MSEVEQGRLAASSHLASPSHTPHIFELDLVDHEPRATPVPVQHDDQDTSKLCSAVDRILRPPTQRQKQLVQDVHRYLDVAMAEEGRHDLPVVAVQLASVGYDVAIRTAKGGGTGQACFENLSHKFIMVYFTRPLPGDDAEPEDAVIIDVAFRDQFWVAHPTPLYAAFMEAAVPACFVGTQQQLLPLVRLLSAQMALCFKDRAGRCPPWRQQRSLLSKWLPKESKKEDVQVAAPPSRPASPDLLGSGLAEGGSSCEGGSPSSIGAAYDRRPCCGASPDSFLPSDGSRCSKCPIEPPVKTSGFAISQTSTKGGPASSRTAEPCPARPSTPDVPVVKISAPTTPVNTPRQGSACVVIPTRTRASPPGSPTRGPAANTISARASASIVIPTRSAHPSPADIPAQDASRTSTSVACPRPSAPLSIPTGPKRRVSHDAIPPPMRIPAPAGEQAASYAGRPSPSAAIPVANERRSFCPPTSVFAPPASAGPKGSQTSASPYSGRELMMRHWHELVRPQNSGRFHSGGFESSRVAVTTGS